MESSNQKLFHELAMKFMKSFTADEIKIYTEHVINRYEPGVFKLIYDAIVDDDSIKYFPRPIEFERLYWKLRPKNKHQKNDYVPTPADEEARIEFVKNMKKMLVDMGNTERTAEYKVDKIWG